MKIAKGVVWVCLLSLVFVTSIATWVANSSGSREFLNRLCSADFMPHGQCYLWLPEIVWLHVGSDALIALSYLLIPICLIVFVLQRKGLRFEGVFWLFGLFILFCGLTHALSIYSVWFGAYRLTGVVKLMTGLISLATAIYLIRALPTLLALPLPNEFKDVTARLGDRDQQLAAILKGDASPFLLLEPIEVADGGTFDFLVKEWNAAAGAEFGKPREKVIGEPIERALSFARRLGLREKLNTALREESTSAENVKTDRNGGEDRWLSMRIVPAGNILGVFFADVTESKAAEERRALRLERERDSNAARAQAAIASAAHGVLIVDGDGVIVQSNRQLQSFFGYGESELLGQKVEMLVPSENSRSHAELRTRFHERPEVRKMGSDRYLEGIRKDGTRFPVEVGLNPFETEEGRFVMASVLDITQRLETRRALEQSELRLQQAVEGGNVGLWHWIDIEKDEEWWSSKFYEMLGYEEGEIEANLSAFRSLLHPEDRERTFEAVEGCLKRGEVFRVDYRLKLKSGEYRWFCASAASQVDEMTGVKSMIGSIQDIQSRKNSEALIKQANRELENKNTEMEQMLYAVSHDLKSPLVSIQGLVRLLMERGSFEIDSMDDLLERIDRSAQHMSDLISDLLSMSRVGHERDEIQVVDIGEIVEATRSGLTVQSREANCRWMIAEDLPKIWANPTRVRQLLENLCSNALKYGCDKEDNAIEIGWSRGENYFEVYVRDFGPGIAEECQESVFELFKRIDRSKEGTGIGLAIVSKIMRLFDGDVFLFSEEGKGSTFVLRFPAEVLAS